MPFRNGKMKKKLKISYNAPVLLTFVLASLIVTIVGAITNNSSTFLLFSIRRGSLIDPLFYVRLFTHVLGHFNFEHFIGNAMILLLVGPMLEEKYGSNNMLKVIVTTAFVTGIFHCVFWGNSSLCGASGIVFACIVMASFTSFKEGEIPLSFILIGIMYLGREIYTGITVVDNISNITHILGGVVGGFYGYTYNKQQNKKYY